MTTASFHFDRLLLPDGWAKDVRLTVVDGLVADVRPGEMAIAGDARFALAMPGIPNLHSHAFQRGMAGLAETAGPAGDSFWTWRDIMYRFVDRLTPDDLHAIAAMAYVEMLETGFTRVGEFHYLHHDRDGARFADPAEMTVAIVRAAQETGIALTHLPVFYAQGGFGGAPAGAGQRRFVHDLDGFAALLDRVEDALRELPDARLGIAPHSLRAVTPDQLTAVAALAGGRPIHIHVAEQMREVNDCLAWSGRRPVDWLLDHCDVSPNWCLVHATHMTPGETRALARSGAVAGLCPITEANLGDGLFPAPDFVAAGGRYGIGSDSNVRIDAAEELRWLEYGQRLAAQGRNLLSTAPGTNTGGAIVRAAVAGGAQALGVAAGLAPGAAADFVSLDPEHPAMAAASADRCLDAWVFAAGSSAIAGVWRRGLQLVEEGRHQDRETVAARYVRTIARLLD